MMNKIFVGLFILTTIGAGVLFWLMKSIPTTEGHDPTKPNTEIHETANGGVKIIEKGSKALPDEEKESDQTADAEVRALEGVKASTKAPRLNITSTPVPALVFIDGEMRGQTPVSVELTSEPQSIKLEAAGYSEVLKETPTNKEVGNLENLNWRVALKRLETPVAASAPKSALAPKSATTGPKKITKTVPIDKVKASPSTADHAKAPGGQDDDFLHGRGGPVWIQVKAVPVEGESSIKNTLQDLRSKSALALVACEVEISGKGRWYRVLSGPFDNRVEATMSLEGVQKNLAPAAFITGVQQCL